MSCDPLIELWRGAGRENHGADEHASAAILRPENSSCRWVGSDAVDLAVDDFSLMNDEPQQRASKSDLQMVRRAIREHWPMSVERWEAAARQAVEVIVDPTASRRHKLGAVLLFVDAASYSTFDVEGSVKRLLGGRQVEESD